MGKKISMADQFYDACCVEYTLKYRDPGEFRSVKTGKGGARISSYGIEGVGTLALCRVSGSFGGLVESAVFTPTEKDAPILMMDYVRTLFNESLSINVFKTQISPLSYRQFSALEESYAKLADAEVPQEWYNSLLIPGSVAKKGKSPELSEMLEEYLNAYLRIISFAVSCKEIEKAASTRELSRGFLEKGGTTAGPLVKNLGKDDAGRLFDELIFPLKR